MSAHWPPRPLHWPDRPLTTRGVVLDRMVPDDIPAIVAAIDEEILRWLPLPAPYTEQDAVTFLNWQAQAAERGETLNFALRAEPGGVLLGSIGLHFRGGPGVAEIGYWIGPPARGRGLAAAGSRLLAAHAFATYRPRRIELLVEPGNAASRRTAENTGAVYEGVRRAALDHRGEVRDAAVYSLLPQDL